MKRHYTVHGNAKRMSSTKNLSRGCSSCARAALIAALCAVASFGNAAGNAPAETPDSIMPAGAEAFVESVDLTTAAGIAHMLFGENGGKAGAGPACALETLKAHTGVDALDPAASEKAGIDPSKPVALALYGREGAGAPQWIVSLHCTRRNAFPAPIAAKISRKSAGKHGNAFRKHEIYEIRQSGFCATTGSRSLISSSRALLEESLRLDGGQSLSSLAADPVYAAFRGAIGGDYPVRVFTRSGNPGILKNLSALPPNNDGAPEREECGRSTASLRPGKTHLLEYAGAGVRRNGSRISFRLAWGLDGKSPEARILAGAPLAAEETCLHDGDAYLFSALSINIAPIDTLCDNALKQSALCSIYDSVRRHVREYTGIVTDARFAESFGGTVNLIVKKSGDGDSPETLTLFLSMKSADKSRRQWRTIRDTIEREHDEQGDFSVTRGGETPAFRFTNRYGRVVQIAAGDDGLYATVGEHPAHPAKGVAKRSFHALCADAGEKNLPMEPFGLVRLRLADAKILKSVLLLSTYESNRLLYTLLLKTEKLEILAGKRKNCFIGDADFYTID